MVSKARASTKAGRRAAKRAEWLHECGYCGISNRHLIVSRIDREDWEDAIGAGLSRSLGQATAADHYRRAVSNDRMEVDRDTYKALREHPKPTAYRPATPPPRTLPLRPRLLTL